MPEIKKILFPVDFSESSDWIASYVADFAQKFKAKVYLLHVVSYLTDLSGFYVPHVSLDNLQKDMEEAAQKEMEEFCRQRMKEVPDLESKVVTGSPFLEIIKMAEEKGVDLIIMGTRGRTGLEQVLFGSVARKVVRRAPCPVLTVRLPEKKDSSS